jgi:Flp pilus assembly protein TadD
MLRQASVLSSSDDSIREHLAVALFQGGEYREAADVLAQLTAKPEYAQRADLLTALGECYMALNRPRDARPVFDTVTQIDPASSAAWLRLGKAAMELNDLRRAELSLRKALSLDGSSRDVHLMMGYLRLRQDRLADALTSFNKAAVLDRTDTVSLCMIGYVLEKMGRPRQAMDYYAQALKLRPQDELASRLMAQVDLNE